ncbi:uncharacterized protein LOC121733425 isoform X2 [Aricia agestis]|uniref:uncharacterized protein LOC121733425 isoform X2 n=1 Tax=Aricia agestis TaxID=91739 RepID=UPI001C205FCE|nr:uncharacterized protein LOC121733425 isoform X2 [Aricia agestis]
MNSSTKALPMTKDETMVLVQLIAANPIVNNKATNATNNKLKEEAWQSLSDQFNSSVSSFPRTPTQLRLKWENLKKSARRRSASIRSSQNKTGGGKDYFPPDEVLDKVASLLPKKSFSSKTSRPSSPQSEYPIRANHTDEPQAVNDKKQEEHENNKIFTYLKYIKDLLEKTLDKEESIRDNLRPKRRLMQEASVSKQKAPQCSNAKETLSPEISRPSSPQSEYPLQENHTVEPQAVNDKKQEEHENNKIFTYLEGIKDILEKTLDKEESIGDNLRPKRRLMQEASVNKQNAPESSNAFHKEIDGDKYFVLSLVPTLKQMSDDQKLAAKMKIMQALQEVRKMNINQNIMYVEDNMKDTLKVEYLDEDNSDSSFS